MFYSIFTTLVRRFTRMGCSILMAIAVMGATQVAMAGPTVDQLSKCLVKSTTAADKTTVLQWTFVALSAHPELKKFSNVNEEQRTQLDKNLAQVLQRILVEQCSAQTKAVIAAEGVQAVGDSFQELGQITGEEILENPEVKSQLKGVLRYVDLNKLVMTFLTPEVWNKLGSIRGN
ncbi:MULTISPECIES: hypothetical protein [unclassified Acinetobacter]|uniref:hypothetical protein n=1 Tax=unclassified Acinetobacter TaxID=196816 RepID=UPI000A330AF6|nr:hypothetical protein [Acinetobacter sp. ANC 4218]OTG70918.1 hypothetical protein B9T38_11465 [Acinetobacter sp. ANC 4218]